MTIMEYEAWFNKLARHATSILYIKYDRVGCSVLRLRLPLLMSTQRLVLLGGILLRYFIMLR